MSQLGICGSNYAASSHYDSDESDSDDDFQAEGSDYGSIPYQQGSKKFINKGRWTKDEDEKLKNVVDAVGVHNWAVIANYFPDRSDVQCQHRWQKVLNPELIKGPWTKEEDDKVLQLVQQYGPKRWTIISKHLKGRTGKQCRERWHNHLNPEIKKCAWTEEEDRMIYQIHKRLGNKWAEIAKYLPGSLLLCNSLYHNSHISQGHSQGYSSDAWSTNSNHGSTPQPPQQIAEVKPESVEPPQQWLVNQDGILSPAVDMVPDIGVDNLFSDDGEHDNLTTYNFLCGSDSNSLSPYKVKCQQKRDNRVSVANYIIYFVFVDVKDSSHSYFSGSEDLSKTEIKQELHTPKTVALIKNESGTPDRSPIKGLPFSPSQFLNSPTIPYGHGGLTSTPVCRDLLNITPISNRSRSGTPGVKSENKTPRFRRSLMDSAPRTPTPFKNALAELEKRNGALKPLSETPGQLVEDLTKVIEEDGGVLPFLSYKPGFYNSPLIGRTSRHQSHKENFSPRPRKARKSLDKKWSTPGDLQLGDTLILPETPSKSLIGDQSIVFSPPSIIKETLHEEKISLNDAFTLPNTPQCEAIKLESGAVQRIHFDLQDDKSKLILDPRWEKIACGKTAVQIEMTKQARHWLTRHANLKPRSLKI
ncbi:hypothetical protein LSH36_275g02011 [Paralvinella palmiformis]|uniref:Uncharacterized protein n=1 Tax=Paralvinella palmiformis TaxID=53620 RepID=A0AAD9N1X9_9ANNE|nr:hypothetical protein LSH36_275g02011 [Paralvinella palmiformis]